MQKLKSAGIAAFAAAIASLSSTALAGFALGYTHTGLNASQDAVLIRAFNTGGGTGTKITALDLTFTVDVYAVSVAPESDYKAYFYVDDTDLDNIPDQVQISNAGNFEPNGLIGTGATFVRLGTAADTFVVASTPTKNVQQPNPWIGGLHTFSVAATTLSPPVANTGTGTVIARFVVDRNATVHVTGVIGGDTGNAVPPTDGIPNTWGTGTLANDSLTDARQSLQTTSDSSLTRYILTVDFSKSGVDPLKFSIDSHSSNSAPIFSSGQTSDISFQGNGRFINGTISASYRGTADFALALSNGAMPGSLRIIAIPEPATLAFASCGVLLLSIRARF